jgi:uncharacterized protein YecE (DUF72 family)
MYNLAMVRVGSCSFTAPGWETAFYPARTPQRDYITRYAERYDTVEIDATFYAVPDPQVVRGWRAKTPEDFVFSAKIPRVITHEKSMVDCRIELDAFLESMSELQDKLGVLVFQFPYFNKETLGFPEFSDRLDSLLEALPDGKYAVEVRNRDWIGEPLFQLLQRHSVAFAPTDFPGMPSVGSLRAVDAITSSFVYVRLLGDRIYTEEMLARHLGEVSFSETVIDRSSELEQWARWIDELAKKDISVYVYINNHYSGFAPRDIDDLKGRLGLEVVLPRPPSQSVFEF